MEEKLVCSICGKEQEIPKCCEKSMLVENDYLLCCCSEECGYQSIPLCCGQKMTYSTV